ncbi:MAG TPA: short-chain dehydrogenase [Gammaproteobacteria bacterium]|nr:short-chain dehydrogenase [Gammaproteobacteria bacterium]
MDLQLRGKHALITGASRGIGRAIAELLASEGCNMTLAARSESSLYQAKEALESKYGVKVGLFAADLSVPESLTQLVSSCHGVDILVNNAGAIPAGSLLDIEDTHWREAWDLKVFGYINLTRLIYRTMISRQSGVIVNIIGLAGERPDAGYIAGSTGNAGLMAFTKALGAKAPDEGVRVVGINPGLVATDRMITIMEARAQAQLGDASRWRELLQHLPFARAAKPEEVAELAAFLVSPRASYISGTVVTIDGGASARAFAY